MADYRMYLLAADRIEAREDFQACSDRCDSFELWREKRKVDSAQGSQPASLAELTQAHQQLVLETAQAILTSEWTIAQSKHLIERIECLKRGWPDVK
jgi:hypothetical protein